MNKLTKEEVLHVANLARLQLTEEEIEKFSYQLKEIMDSINTINDVSTDEQEPLIAPWSNECILRKDEYQEYNLKQDILKNAPKSFDNFIEVGGVLND